MHIRQKKCQQLVSKMMTSQEDRKHYQSGQRVRQHHDGIKEVQENTQSSPTCLGVVREEKDTRITGGKKISPFLDGCEERIYVGQYEIFIRVYTIYWSL